MSYSTEALGRIIRERRELKPMTQQELGSEAGYGAGAGVSISRIEAGRARPSKPRLDGIAKALGTTSEALEREVERQTESIDPTEDIGATDRNLRSSTRERVEALQVESERRTELIEGWGARFNVSHNRARDEFFMPFVTVAQSIADAPQQNQEALSAADDEIDENNHGRSEAILRQKFTASGVANVLASGVAVPATGGTLGGADAYGAFKKAVSIGTALTGATRSGSSSVAATNAATALLRDGILASGSAGAAGGWKVLGGLASGPAVLLAIGGALWVYRKTRSRNRDLELKLGAAEEYMDNTADGVKAIEQILQRASEILEYIAVHAGHALSRWRRDLGSSPAEWNAMSDVNRKQYDAFIQVSACQLSVISIDVNEIAGAQGEELRRLTGFAEEILNQSMKTIEELV